MNRLENVLATDLRILLVAINPAPLSAGSGQPFATPTNAFWRLLLERTKFSNATVFVLPNPSGRNRSYPGFAGKLPWYQELAQMQA